MKSKMSKWGNSMGIRIPRNIASEAQVDYNTEVEINVSNGTIVITPILKRKFTIESLVESISEDSIHPETDTGDITGNEVW